MVKRYYVFFCLTLALLVACVDDKVTQDSSRNTEPDGATVTTDGATFADANADDGFLSVDGRLSDSGARPMDGGLSDAQQGNQVDANGERPSPPIALGGDRPANYFLPLNYDPDTPLPVVIALHGFTGNSAFHNAYLRLGESAQALGLMLILADGRRNRDGNQFWSATDFCCDFYGDGDVDVVYLSSLLDEAKRYFRIDPRRVGVFGHSNGGFMGYRLACDRGDLFSHIISLAGTSWHDPFDCDWSQPVSILQAHGTWDAVIRYLGQRAQAGRQGARPDPIGCRDRHCADEHQACSEVPECGAIWDCMTRCRSTPNPDRCRSLCYQDAELEPRNLWSDEWICMLGYGCFDDPSRPMRGYSGAAEQVSRWVARNQCENTPTDAEPLDLVPSLPGVDTQRQVWATDCDRNTSVQLWTIERGSHSPQFNIEFTRNALQWLLDTPREND